MTIIVRQCAEVLSLGESASRCHSTRPSNNRGSLVALRGGPFGCAERFGQHRPPRRASPGTSTRDACMCRGASVQPPARWAKGGRRSSVPGRAARRRSRPGSGRRSWPASAGTAWRCPILAQAAPRLACLARGLLLPGTHRVLRRTPLRVVSSRAAAVPRIGDRLSTLLPLARAARDAGLGVRRATFCAPLCARFVGVLPRPRAPSARDFGIPFPPDRVRRERREST